MNRSVAILFAAILSLTLGACSMSDLRSILHGDESGSEPSEQPADDTGATDDSTESQEIEIVIEVAEPVPDPGPQELLLQSGQNWLGLSEKARRQELAQAELAWINTPTDHNLVRYALLSALSRPSSSGETDRARNDLRNWLDHQESETDGAELAPLAVVILHLLDDRERVISELNTRIEEVQGKLDELRAIEQQMRERENESTEIIRTLP